MKKQFLALYFLFVFFLAQSQMPINVSFIDGDEVVQVLGEKKLKQSYKKISVAKKKCLQLIGLLQKKGYESAVLDTIFIENNQIYANIFVGPPIKIDEVHLIYSDSTEFAPKKIQKLSKNITTINNLLLYNNEIVRYYENNGYPFASTQVISLTKKEDKYAATIEVDKGELIILDSIITNGTMRLRQSFLYGYLGLKRKCAYNESILQNVNQRLSELGYIKQTQEAALMFAPKKAALYIFADKVKVNQFDGFLGIVPNNETTGKLLLTGQLNLNLTNIFAVGENIKLSWNRPQTQSQTLDIAIDFPFLFFSPFGIDANFGLEKKDTSYLNLSITAGVHYYIQQSNYLRLYYTYKNSRLVANESLTYLTQLPENVDYNMNLYGFSFVWQKLDYIFNPHKGFYLMADVSVGKKKIVKNIKIKSELYDAISKNSNSLHIQMTADFYFPLHKRFTWVLSVQGGHMQANNLYKNELYRIGGLKTLRGFDQLSIYASTYIIVRDELRFSFAQKSYLQLFFDIAGYQQQLEKYVSDFPFGFGAGLSFDTKAGIFAFNYALGRQHGNPIKFSTGKITFGYTALF